MSSRELRSLGESKASFAGSIFNKVKSLANDLTYDEIYHHEGKKGPNAAPTCRPAR